MQAYLLHLQWTLLVFEILHCTAFESRSPVGATAKYPVLHAMFERLKYRAIHQNIRFSLEIF